MGFPPKTKNTNRNIPPYEGDTQTTGSGGIPASLKIKNAGVKPAAFPGKFIDQNSTEQGVTGANTKTNGLY